MKALIWIVIAIVAVWAVIWFVRRTPTQSANNNATPTVQGGSVNGTSTGPTDSNGVGFDSKG